MGLVRKVQVVGVIALAGNQPQVFFSADRLANAFAGRLFGDSSALDRSLEPCRARQYLWCTIPG